MANSTVIVSNYVTDVGLYVLNHVSNYAKSLSQFFNLPRIGMLLLCQLLTELRIS